MTETNERIAILESKMDSVLDVLGKREDYQANVLKQLTIIEVKQDQLLTYQKHCDTERLAHGKRIGDLENKTARTDTTWDTLLRVGSVTGSLIAIALSLLTYLKHP